MLNKLILIAALLFSDPLFAVESRVFSVSPITVKANEPISFILDLKDKEGWEKTDKIQILDSSGEISPSLKILNRGNEYFAWAPVGEHFFRGSQLKINWTKQDFDKISFNVNITVEGTVDPVPPTPPQPANPFPAGKFCLFVEEQSGRAALPNPQQQIFSSTEIFDLLDNAGFAWRILDKDDEFQPNSVWLKPMSSSTDCGDFRIIISNGKNWKKVALPATITETLELIKEFL